MRAEDYRETLIVALCSADGAQTVTRLVTEFFKMKYPVPFVLVPTGSMGIETKYLAVLLTK